MEEGGRGKRGKRGKRGNELCLEEAVVDEQPYYILMTEPDMSSTTAQWYLSASTDTQSCVHAGHPARVPRCVIHGNNGASGGAAISAYESIITMGKKCCELCGVSVR
ncbi:unnamed protein product [Pleuronectes platessa]|uniref:Uncharacterized protein n=1 Tax=Pleuronectes platessa TaxID=8262 RepID=A0A9N7VH46_PLEPL|nr:unnamed protein product [Pleuronectes platessa]